MVATRIDSKYTGRTRDWLKIKTESGIDEMQKDLKTGMGQLLRASASAAQTSILLISGALEL